MLVALFALALGAVAGFVSGWAAAERRFRARRMPLVVGAPRPGVILWHAPRGPFAERPGEWM